MRSFVSSKREHQVVNQGDMVNSLVFKGLHSIKQRNLNFKLKLNKRNKESLL